MAKCFSQVQGLPGFLHFGEASEKITVNLTDTDFTGILCTVLESAVLGDGLGGIEG